MSRDHHDALLDQLLREILGGDRPRDMTARVLAQAKIIDRFRRRWWVSAASAIAASITLAASLYMFWPQQYPALEIHGVAVMDGGEAERGKVLQTDEFTSGNLKIGGFVNVDISPQTTLTLGGTKFQEKVFLAQGELDVTVLKNKGKFDVAVGPATVHVTGTKFNVNLLNDETSTEQRKKLLVSVWEGTVEVQGIPGLTGTERLSAGQQKEFVIFFTPKMIAPINKSLRGGLLAAAQEGARTGNRGGVVGRPEPAARGMIAQAIQQARGNRPVQLILNPPSSDRIYGILRRDHDLFYLEVLQGPNFYMFPASAVPNSAWKLPVGQAVGVKWAEGKVTDVTP